MAEFSAGLHTRQEERYVTLRFLLPLGGIFTSFFMTIALAIPPLTVKNKGDAFIQDRALNRANTVRMKVVVVMMMVMLMMIVVGDDYDGDGHHNKGDNC